jgi:hypothetical protein
LRIGQFVAFGRTPRRTAITAVWVNQVTAKRIRESYVGKAEQRRAHSERLGQEATDESASTRIHHWLSCPMLTRDVVILTSDLVRHPFALAAFYLLVNSHLPPPE